MLGYTVMLLMYGSQEIVKCQFLRLWLCLPINLNLCGRGYREPDCFRDLCLASGTELSNVCSVKQYKSGLKHSKWRAASEHVTGVCDNSLVSLEILTVEHSKCFSPRIKKLGTPWTHELSGSQKIWNIFQRHLQIFPVNSEANISYLYIKQLWI